MKDHDPLHIVDATGNGHSDVEREFDECAQCHKTWPHDPALPPSSVDEHGVRMLWCSDACADAWLDADPKRREGWIPVSDLEPAVLAEKLAEKLAEVGLHVDAPPRRPS